MPGRIVKKSQLPPPPEPEGYGDVVRVMYGQTHAVVSVEELPYGKEVGLACSRTLRISSAMKPANRFVMRRDDLSGSVSCMNCRDHLELDRAELDTAAAVR